MMHAPFWLSGRRHVSEKYTCRQNTHTDDKGQKKNSGKRTWDSRFSWTECEGGAILPSLYGAAPHHQPSCSTHPIRWAEVLSRGIQCPGSFHSQVLSSLSHREDIWFDDVDPDDIEAAVGPEAAMLVRKRLGQRTSTISLVKEQAFGG